MATAAFLIFASTKEALDFKRWANNLEKPVSTHGPFAVEISGRFWPKLEFPSKSQSQVDDLQREWRHLHGKV